jgi:hypothetical protein
MADPTAEEFNEKVAEVFGNLGVAVAAVVTDASSETVVRAAWRELGKSFAELMDMTPPR